MTNHDAPQFLAADTSAPAQTNGVLPVGTRIAPSNPLPVTVVSLVEAAPKFDDGKSTLITLETASGQHLLWFRKRPTTLAAGDQIVLAKGYIKSKHKLGYVTTQISLEDNSPLRPAE